MDHRTEIGQFAEKLNAWSSRKRIIMITSDDDASRSMTKSAALSPRTNPNGTDSGHSRESHSGESDSRESAESHCDSSRDSTTSNMMAPLSMSRCSRKSVKTVKSEKTVKSKVKNRRSGMSLPMIPDGVAMKLQTLIGGLKRELNLKKQQNISLKQQIHKMEAALMNKQEMERDHLSEMNRLRENIKKQHEVDSSENASLQNVIEEQDEEIRELMLSVQSLKAKQQEMAREMASKMERQTLEIQQMEKKENHKMMKIEGELRETLNEVMKLRENEKRLVAENENYGQQIQEKTKKIKKSEDKVIGLKVEYQTLKGKNKKLVEQNRLLLHHFQTFNECISQELVSLQDQQAEKQQEAERLCAKSPKTVQTLQLKSVEVDGADISGDFSA